MSITDAQLVSNDYRTSIICLDSYEGKHMCGRLYNPYYIEEKHFVGLIELLYSLDGLADIIHYPKAAMEHRMFKPKNHINSSNAVLFNENRKTGLLATFAIKIMFRQNASWQGSIHWLEEDVQECFRSALELIFLIDSVMEPSEKHTQQVKENDL